MFHVRKDDTAPLQSMDSSAATPPVKLSILLPVIGQGMSLRAMLKVLALDVPVPYEIIIVHDGSQEQTRMLADAQSPFAGAHSAKPAQAGADAQPARVMPPVKAVLNDAGGTLSAIKSGVSAASGKYILLVCADSVGPILGISQMLEMADEGFEFISGTRYAGGGRRLGGGAAWVELSRFANTFLRQLCGCAFTDATTGLKLFRKDVLERLHLETDTRGWVIAFEMALKAQAAQLKLGEVANISVDRLCGGCSTYQVEREFLHYLRWFVWALVRLRASHVERVPVRPLRQFGS